MFQLLVSYNGWDDSGDTIPTGRIYIKPGAHPDESVLTNGKLDISKVSRTPAVLMAEIDGPGPQIARLAYINHIAQGPRVTSIQYSFDTSIPGISNADLQKYAATLGIESALNHTHWEVCSGDLFRVLLMAQLRDAASKPRPTMFSTAAIDDQDDDLVSVMMPFGAEFLPVYAALQEAANSIGFQCQRADDIWVHHHVIQDIVDLIAKAKVVVCDCSGKNPNVFYEIGIAHSLGKEVILIARSDDDIPFDLSHIRYLTYLPNKEGLEELSEGVRDRLKTLTGKT
ncbi:MAG: hypothetical protein ACO1PN_10790 [Betaproteobacteria bacterium]